MKGGRVTFLDCPLDLIAPAGILQRANTSLRGQGRLRIEGLNVAKLIEARGAPALLAALQEAELVHVDGAGISLGLRAVGISAPERRAGIDLMVDLCHLAAAAGKSVYLLGARAEVVRMTAQKLRDAVPGLTIAGTRDGYFTEKDEMSVVESIKRSGAGLLFIGISSPKKELFLQTHWECLGVPLAMGVGGAFDVLSGLLQRAPVWMQSLGMEWLFRMAQEPRRLLGRYVRTNLRFLWLIVAVRLTKFRTEV